MKAARTALIAGVFVICCWTTRFAADVQQGSLEATIVDPQHYHLEFENEFVRVIRVKVAPGDSVMHQHPAPGGVVVYLTDQDMQQTFADGTRVDNHYKRGQVRWTSTTVPHRDNASHPFELIRIEPKIH
jgi:hypothetical protein